MIKFWLIALVVANVGFVGPQLEAAHSPRKGAFLTVFGGDRLRAKHASSHIRNDLDPNVERYYVYVPSAYTGSESYGLIVFTDADSQAIGLPASWQAALDTRKYIYVAAQNAGNDQPQDRRLGLAVLGALKAMGQYNIDPTPVYAAGFSGGARMAGLLGFYESDIFHGTIQICGADFYARVPIVAATSQLDTEGQPYGMFRATQQEISNARAVHFALVTGTDDFRRGNILDIFHGGFERLGFHARIFDIRGMGHAICDGDVLSRVLNFLEAR
ncbi:MAG: hypothetical protein M3O09_10815 [Acidobacteriota bacterium]|nr:hypothetical protein [Acidobacteriota bacterium]